MLGSRPERSNGFTLIELLVVIAILGTLVAMLIPAVQAVRNSARRTGCSNNLRQVGISLTNFEAANGKYPPGQSWVSKDIPFSYSWAAHALAFLENQTLLDQLNLDEAFISDSNMLAASQLVEVYVCPATSLRESHRNADERLTGVESGFGNGLACTDYLGIAGPSKTWNNPSTGMDYGSQRGVLIGIKGLDRDRYPLQPPAIRVKHIIDGLSNTACVTECSGRGLDGDGDFHGAWVSGKNIGHVSKKINDSKPPKVWTKERIYSQHPGGAQFLYCDGSVQFHLNDTEKDVLKAICSRNGED